MKFTLPLALTLTACIATSAMAGNSLVAPNKSVQVAKSALAVTPSSEWNKLGARPGSNGETWTLDGDGLNKVTFYGGVVDGKTLFREVDKRNKPLPKVSGTMLPTDIPVLLESSYRIALGTSLFSIDHMEPTKLSGADGVKFSYSFVLQGDDVRRKGEGRAAMKSGQLYMITYEAPALYYFDRTLPAFQKLADSMRF
jgi:hypothetical protein